MTDEARTILEKLPELLKQTPQLRYQIYDLLAETFVRRDELTRILDELRAQREASDRRFAAQAEQIRQGFERMDERFKRIDDRISALGSRRGIQTEEAVRGFAREFIATEFGGEVERWRHDHAELDVVMRNGRCCLIEVTSWCDEEKLRRFLRNAEIYTQDTGREPSRRLVVTAHATGPAWKLAQAEGVEIISG